MDLIFSIFPKCRNFFRALPVLGFLPKWAVTLMSLPKVSAKNWVPIGATVAEIWSFGQNEEVSK